MQITTIDRQDGSMVLPEEPRHRAVHSSTSPLDDLDATVSEIVRLANYAHIPSEDGLHLAISLSHAMILAIARLEREGVARERILALVERARVVHADSPFVRRLQQWPRGYAGDFETVEYLLQQQNRATPGRFSYWLEQYALDSSIAQQHRNKVDFQARALVSAVRTITDRIPRLLVLAAGGSPDLRQAESVLASEDFEATLLDQDADALAFSIDRLPIIRDRLTLVNRNVVRGLQEVARRGRFDLVLAGGLFDYLPDKVAISVLRIAREYLLADRGQFVFTNIAAGSPFRHWIEYMADWRLIHRTAAEIRALCAAAGYDSAAVDLGTDKTGLTLIVTCHAGGREAAPTA